ncbi:hypothetical protein [Segatella salivae]|uniref:hypothetical protein n=1 Tax=Segatella salivae TaxID=228604 RepID=UPI0028DB96A3|nr:hypothetical protein [Segatella salivae]
MNVIMTQRRIFYAIIPMNVFGNINALMVQRRRCCSFDSPGLARNEPTLGKHSQGDSTL